MRYKSRAPLTENEKQTIVDYYLFPHNLRPTAKKFNRGIPTIKAVLAERDIPLHDPATKHACELLASKATCNEKYGKDFTFQTESNIQKSKQTKLEKYGNANWNNTEKAKQTCLAKYGVENYTQTKEYLAKQKHTCIKKYGAKSYIESTDYKRHLPDILAKQKQTNQTRYNADWFSQTTEGKKLIREKSKKTVYRIYGVYYYSQTQEWRNKVKSSWATKSELEKSGIINKRQCTNLIKYGSIRPNNQKYIMIEHHFDSFPELCIWMYCQKNNIQIKREATCFAYWYNGSKHLYFPDFEIDGQLIEIKGNQFLNSDGTWKNPFDRSQDALYEAKHKCAIEHNVKILYNRDYQKYIDWFNDQGYKKEEFLMRGKN